MILERVIKWESLWQDSLRGKTWRQKYPVSETKNAVAITDVSDIGKKAVLSNYFGNKFKNFNEINNFIEK